MRSGDPPLNDVPQTKPARLWLGCILIAGGALLAISCGACTLHFVGEMAFDHIPSTEAYLGDRMAATSPVASSLVAFVVGGMPTAAGIAIIIGGLRLVRVPPADRPGAGE